METQLNGPITNYIDLIGRGIDGIQEQVDKATNDLACEPLIEDTDESFLGAGSTESYWSYYNMGLELLWRNNILVSLSIFLQDDGSYEEPYIPFPQQLIASLPNEATIDELVSIFGQPESEGGIGGCKNLRYMISPEKYIVFCFNGESTLRSVQLGLTRVLKH